MSEKHTCAEKVFDEQSRQWRSCRVSAKYEHEGGWYCKRHYPPSARARDDERRARWIAERKAGIERAAKLQDMLNKGAV